MLCKAGAWAKLAFERPPDGRPIAASVVTRDVWGDGSGPAFTVRPLHLRTIFTAKADAFHVSTDCRDRDLFRVFGLPAPVTAIDNIAQSPTGDGYCVAFDQAHWISSVPANLREGS